MNTAWKANTVLHLNSRKSILILKMMKSLCRQANCSKC